MNKEKTVSTVNEIELEPFEAHGFKNAETGEIVIEAKYDFTRGFIGDLADVKLNNKWGYIDKTGKVVVPIIYDQVWQRDGIVIAMLADIVRDKIGMVKEYSNVKYGIIDTNSGDEFVPLQYDEVDVVGMLFYPIMLKVKLNGKYGLIDFTRKEVVPIIYDSIERTSATETDEKITITIRIDGELRSFDYIYETREIVEVLEDKK